MMAAGALVAALLFRLPTSRLLTDERMRAGDVDAGTSTGAAGGRLPLRLVIALGAVAFAAFVSEGAAMDWAALHANRVLGADLSAASLAYIVFTAAMTTMRLRWWCRFWQGGGQRTVQGDDVRLRWDARRPVGDRAARRGDFAGGGDGRTRHALRSHGALRSGGTPRYRAPSVSRSSSQTRSASSALLAGATVHQSWPSLLRSTTIR